MIPLIQLSLPLSSLFPPPSLSPPPSLPLPPLSLSLLGFDSLAGDYSYGPDDTGTLKQVYSTTTNPLNTSGNTSTLRPLNSHNSTDSGYRDDHKPPPPLPPLPVSAPSSEKTKPKLKKKTSFTSAFKVLRRASKDVT